MTPTTIIHLGVCRRNEACIMVQKLSISNSQTKSLSRFLSKKVAPTMGLAVSYISCGLSATGMIFLMKSNNKKMQNVTREITNSTIEGITIARLFNN